MLTSNHGILDECVMYIVTCTILKFNSHVIVDPKC